MKKLFWTIYVVGFVVTYGYIYNTSIARRTRVESNFPVSNETASRMDSLLGSVVWPIYWPCHFSVKIWMSYEVK